ncbi:MAG: NUDIX hydrolase [Luteibaculum sp.]
MDLNKQFSIEKLKQRLQNPLPGEKAHEQMASYRRPSPADVKRKRLGAREAGVLIALFAEGNELFCPLIQRPDYDGTHSGQVAFPGGKKELNDADITHTALRESHEEIGLSGDLVHTLGHLSQLYIPPSNFLVTPTLALLDEKPKYIPDPSEVSEVFSFPLQILKSDKYFRVKRIYLPYYGMHINAPVVEYNDKTIWGATAMMLAELKEVLEDSAWL